MRKLKNGEEVVELDTPVSLEVYTKCPGKWKLIDMETGQEYIGNIPDNNLIKPMYWKRIN